VKKKTIFIYAMLAIIIFFLGAQAATAYPVTIRIGDTEIIFLPLILKSKAADAPSGVLYVFSSTTTSDGNAGGRSLMGDICPTEDPDSHFCSLHEIENAWTTTGVYFNSAFQTSWVDVPVKLGSIHVLDSGQYSGSVWHGQDENCGSWNSSDSDYSGRVITDNASVVGGQNCGMPVPVACCKQIP